MKILSSIVGLLAPSTTAHGLMLDAQSAHEREIHLRNAAMVARAMDMAERGYRVKLTCTNRTWFDFACEPTEKTTETRSKIS